MSQASASENPAPAAGPLSAAITGYGISAQIDDRRVQCLGAATDLCRQVDRVVFDASCEPVDVAAGAEGVAGAGHDQAA